MLAIFNSLEDAGRTVSDIIADGIIPATLEIMDNLVIRAVEESVHAGYPQDAQAVLIIELDGLTDGMDEQADRKSWPSAVKRGGQRPAGQGCGRTGRALGGPAGRFRRRGPASAFLLGLRLRTVPRTRLPAALSAVKRSGKSTTFPSAMSSMPATATSTR
ncbi:MAG: hypothetical protein MZV49_00150 [Rhodopseudomonas palustris]|nr:hypothetical protein [Rhodopseudomonas palustris]